MTNAMTAALAVTALILASSAFGWLAIGRYRRLAREQVALADRLSAFGLAQFAALAANRAEDQSEQIVREDIERALSKSVVTPEDRELLVALSTRMPEIGHAIGTKTMPSLMVVPTRGSVMVLPSTKTVTIYAISRQDLETYPARRRHEWRRWL
jgi:hypothetical protein